MLRWSSLRLCHLVNHERHSVYGETVARQVAEAAKKQMSFMDVPLDLQHLAGYQGVTSRESSLQKNAWKHLAPFLPRPIISLHVRQGDKGGEMSLYPFSAYMFLAERIRYHSPDANHIWLSTEMQVNSLILSLVYQ
jgi:hypothetical protein